MSKSIFEYIWQYSRREQIVLLLLTLVSFPFLYMSLELPKQIINDAIGGDGKARSFFGMALTQMQLLMLLCIGFILAILIQGLMKMWINTRKGVLSETMLRRFRALLLTRLLRFPRRQFHHTSQGELVSLMTAEAEALGGIMGDLIAKPAFQGGMMLTITGFLFVQNLWLGLSAVALIPVQAWLIPMLQRQLNELNRQRVAEVRHFAEEIGESAAGMRELRTSGGWYRRLAVMGDRIQRLFHIRLRIYRKKFLMKFLNNFITQLTPFLFYSIGGYLVIVGQLTIGALVAAIAAYKDISAPWRELLAWYNQVQDAKLRWGVIRERFEVANMFDETLFACPGDAPGSLRGPLVFDDVTLHDEAGFAVLENLNFEILAGSTYGIASASAIERQAIEELLTRETLPSLGTIQIARTDIRKLDQDIIGARIGHVGPEPYIFAGDIGQNVLMPLHRRPKNDSAALRDGILPLSDSDWLDLKAMGFSSEAEVKVWWMKIIQAMGLEHYVLDRALDMALEEEDFTELTARIIALRPVIAERIAQAQLGDTFFAFDRNRFNPGLPFGENLLFAIPAMDISQVDLAHNPRFSEALKRLDPDDEAFTLGEGIMTLLGHTFGSVPSEHPLFRNLGIDEELFARMRVLATRSRDKGIKALTIEERLLISTIPFRLAPDCIGIEIPKAVSRGILAIRKRRNGALPTLAGDLFTTIRHDAWLPALSLFENAIYGKVARGAGAKTQKLRDLVSTVLTENGLAHLTSLVTLQIPTAIGGANLDITVRERIAFARAVIKRPDILVLNQALASHGRHERRATHERLRELLPDVTLIFLEEEFPTPERFTGIVQINGGRIAKAPATEREATGDIDGDFYEKLRMLEQADLFSGLDRTQLRLLAYESQWVTARQGETLFDAGDRPDGCYLMVSGEAELRWPGGELESAVPVGRTVGYLPIFHNGPRRLDLVALGDVRVLRVAAQELRAIVLNDATAAVSLLSAIARSFDADQVGARREGMSASL